MTKPKICSIEGCNNSLSPHSIHDTCQQCRSSQYYWNKKRPAQIIERRRKLNVFGSRLDTFFPGNKR